MKRLKPRVVRDFRGQDYVQTSSETVKNKKKISTEEAILRLKETGEYQILKKKVTIEWVEI